VNEVDNVFLYDIDDLQGVVKCEPARARERGGNAEGSSPRKWIACWRPQGEEDLPAIVSLREQLEEIRLAEIGESGGKLGGLTPQQEEALEHDSAASSTKSRPVRFQRAAQAGRVLKAYTWSTRFERFSA